MKVLRPEEAIRRELVVSVGTAYTHHLTTSPLKPSTVHLQYATLQKEKTCCANAMSL